MKKKIFEVYLANKKNIAGFYLGTEGENPLIFLELNPSTDNQEKSDRTITNVSRFADRFGYDSFLMINLYPYGSTDLNKLPIILEPKLHPVNIKNIKKPLKMYKKPDIVPCWGTKIILRTYLITRYQEIIKSINLLIGKIYRLGELVKNGYPRYPSRISYNVKLSELII